jgi:predicted alpha/beta-fold hydrolase
MKEGINDYILKKSGKTTDYYSVKRAMLQIANPVLWIHDEDDDITPIEDIKPLLDKQPENIEFMITHGLGHRKIYKDNNVVKKVISFLTSGQNSE